MCKIELAVDEENTIGVLNYLFVNTLEEEHIDAVDYIKRNNEEREEFYTIENIKKCLDKIDKKLFENFLKIILFDALTGEQDRHEENWGVTRKNGKLYMLGYVHRFYSRELSKMLEENIKYSAQIKYLNFETNLRDEDITVDVKLILQT